MNERIKELLHESIDNCDGTMTDRTYSLKSSELEKFAQLIIRDCAEWCGHDPSGVAAMLKHYGVKE